MLEIKIYNFVINVGILWEFRNKKGVCVLFYSDLGFVGNRDYYDFKS